MIAKIYNLPDEMLGNNLGEFNYVFYRTTQPSVKNRILFSQNVLCFLLEGEKYIFNSGEASKANKTKLILIQSGISLLSENLCQDSCSFKSMLIFISNEFLIEFLSKNVVVNPTHETLLQNGHFVFEKDDFLINFQNSLLLLSSKHESSEIFIRTKIEEILLYLYIKYPSEIVSLLQNTLRKQDDSLLKEVVRNNLDNNLTLSELAFLSNMSLSTFKRKFFEVYNTTPRQYFIRHKMDKAKIMLRKHMKPSEIFYNLGYENLSAFSGEFKKINGISPRDFIQNLNF